MDALPSILKLSPSVIRVLGQNPGKFTLQGTNTYLVGFRAPYLLLDAGDDVPAYIPLLRAALAQYRGADVGASTPDISDIILTHRHHDHTDGLPRVLALLRALWTERHASPGGADVDADAAAPPFVPPRLHKFPLPAGYTGHASHAGHTARADVFATLAAGSYTASPSGGVLHDLAHGQRFAVSGAPPGGADALEVVHTPGHTPDSVCLHHAADVALFTADTVLGGSTAVFEDLAAYLQSLRALLDLRRAAAFDTLYPGHGDVVPDGQATLEMYIKHRMEREASILQILHLDPADAPPPGPGEKVVSYHEEEAWTVWNIVRTMYKNYPQDLWVAAASSVELHLVKLAKEGRVTHLGGEGRFSEWELGDQ